MIHLTLLKEGELEGKLCYCKIPNLTMQILKNYSMEAFCSGYKNWFQ